MQAKKLNFAIIGTGSIASNGHAPALIETEKAQLWSVLSRNQERAQEFARKFKAQSATPAYSSLVELLADRDLDAVIIATPDKLHAETAVAAMRAGKHVLLEKPLATDREGVDLILESYAQSKVKLGLCYRLRWHAGHRLVKEAVQRGDFGEIRHVRSLWAWRQADATNWRASTEVGKWWSLAAVGTHLIDLARWMLLPEHGEITNLESVIANQVWQGPHDETALLTFKFASGATAEVCSSVLFDAPSRLEIYGSSGWVVCEDTFHRDGKGKIWTNRGGLSFPVTNPFLGLIDNFVDAVRTDNSPEVDVFEGAANAKLLLRVAA
ncbi:Gfo/Idh/MocA family oxidoreductase [bacterium]|nr:Gfo/Idh/MocA family oxidoreductase [bacterium]